MKSLSGLLKLPNRCREKRVSCISNYLILFKNLQNYEKKFYYYFNRSKAIEENIKFVVVIPSKRWLGV